MKQNRRYDWPALLTAFEQSGLSQTQFCEENNLNAKYFSLRRAQLLSEKDSAFQKIEVQSKSPSSDNLTIQVGRCNITCPDSMSIQAFSTLVHSLA